MLDFLKRSRLIRRGLASKKTRRRRTRNELLQSLECANYVKIVILAGFVAGLAFLIFSGQQPEPTKNFVIALLFLAVAVTQLVDQPAQDVFAKLARPPGLRHYARATGSDEASARPLQRRHIQIPEAGNGRVDRALCIRAAGVERVARAKPRTLCRRLSQSLEQHFVWGNRRAAPGLRSDQRIHRGLSHAAGAPAEQTDPGWSRRRARHLAALTRFRAHRSD